MISPHDAKLVISKYVTYPDVSSVPGTIAKKAEFLPFMPFATAVGHAIWGALLAFKQGGPSGLLKHLTLKDAVKAAMGPVLKVLPVAMQALKNKVENYLVAIFKKLT
jgi:hypothetical protein